MTSRAVILALCAGCATTGGKQGGADASRALFQSAQQAVVTVRLVLKMSMGSRDRETKTEAIGTLIDPSGLTVVPVAAVDPTSLMRSMMSGRGMADKFSGTVTEAALLLADGTELEADVVYKDADLGLAFVRPREPPKDLAPVQLKATPPAQVLDEVVLVGRFGRGLNRAPWVDTTRVRAVVKGPRPFAVCGEEAGAMALGTLAYGLDGAPIGVFVTRPIADADSFRSFGQSGLVILRPISDLLEAAEQARAAKAPAAAQ